MNIFMVGGTGLLGREAARELIDTGHKVTALSHRPLPRGADIPQGMTVVFGDYLQMSDDALRGHMQGCEGFVFAAGIDERVEGKRPIYELFSKYNIAPLARLLTLAKACGVSHCVVYGSYFSYFDKTRPQDKLSMLHPYIRSRRDQEAAALALAGVDFDVAILELPYIFGVQPGRKPVWVFLVKMIRAMKPVTLFPRGGTSMVTVRQVAQATAGALEKNSGGTCYPIGWYYMSWREFLTVVHKYLGQADKKIVTIPRWMFTLQGTVIRWQQQAKGQEGGLNLAKFASLQCSEQFIDKSLGAEPLGVEADDIDRAIGESIRLSAQILDGKAGGREMQAE